MIVKRGSRRTSGGLASQRRVEGKNRKRPLRDHRWSNKIMGFYLRESSLVRQHEPIKKMKTLVEEQFRHEKGRLL